MILFIRSAAWIFFLTIFFSSAIGLPLQGVKGGSDRARQLRILGEHYRAAGHLLGHPDDVGVVRDDPPRHDDALRGGFHLQHPLDDRVEEPLDDIGHLLPVADVFEDLRRGEDGAVASELHHLPGLAGEGVHLLDGDVEGQGQLLEERAGPRRALPVHLEAAAAPSLVELDDLVVLAADVDHGDRLGEVMGTGLGEATDLGLALPGDEGDVGPAVSRGNGVGDLPAADSGHPQRFIETSLRGQGKIGAGFPDGVAEEPFRGVDDGDLGPGGPDVETYENGLRHASAPSQRSSHFAGRLAMKAVNPSTASWVAINSSRYNRSTSASFARIRSTKPARAARTANRREAALRGARCSSNQASAAGEGSSASASTRPIRCASSAPMPRPEKRRSSARAWPIRSGSRQEAAGANTASLISGLPSIAPGAAKIRWPAAATSRPPPRHWPRTATRTGTGLATSCRIMACRSRSIAAQDSGRCSSTLAPKLKCGPSASRRTARSRAPGRCSRSADRSPAIMAASTMFALGRERRSRSRAPSFSSHAFRGTALIQAPFGPSGTRIARRASRFERRSSTLSMVKPTTDSVAPWFSSPNAVSWPAAVPEHSKIFHRVSGQPFFLANSWIAFFRSRPWTLRTFRVSAAPFAAMTSSFGWSTSTAATVAPKARAICTAYPPTPPTPTTTAKSPGRTSACTAAWYGVVTASATTETSGSVRPAAASRFS